MNDKINHLQEMLDEFNTAMLTTHSKDMQLHTRPMHIAKKTDAGELFFIGRRGSEKVEELMADDRINVAMQGSSRFLTISGHADIEHDSEKVKSMWSKAMAAWFPLGPTDPNIELIHVKPERAELWDLSGTNKMEYLFEAGKAILKGEHIDADKFESEKISF